jgi:hypothetical protein
MWKKRIIASAVASLGLAGSTAAIAQTTNDDLRREDRMAERQDEREDAARAEVRLAVPRNADGSLNTQALLDEIRAQIARGVREIQFRGARLTPEEVRNLLLSTDHNLLAEIAALLPNDGVERQVRLRGALDVRVQREPNGELRARIEDVNLGNLTAAQRAELAQQLAARFGFERLRIQGVDREGREDRADRREDRREDRMERREDRAERREDRLEDRMVRLERPERAERVERPERPERAERMERVERPERSGRN